MSRVLERLPAVGAAHATRNEQLVLAILAFIGVTLLFHDTTGNVVNTWASSAYNHGYAVIPICLFLAWRGRLEAARLVADPDLRGMILVAAVAVVWLLGHLSGTLVIEEFALVAAVQCVFLTMYGWPLTRALAFPLAYLYFAIPLGQAMEPRLQAITATLSVEMLRGVGVPVFADGDLISIPTGRFSIAEECSGLRFLTASIAVGVLFAGIMYRSWWRRAAFLAVAVVLPILANGARAFGIIFLAYCTNNELATGVDHIIYGWIFFSLILFVMFAIGVKFRESAVPHTDAVDHLRQFTRSTATYRIFLAGLIAFIPLSAAKVYGGLLDQATHFRPNDLPAPELKTPWHEMQGLDDPLQPVFMGADAELHKAYEASGVRTYLHIGYFASNRRGAQAVSSAHNFEGGRDWRTAASGAAKVVIDGQSLTVQFDRSMHGNLGHLVWYWYWVDGQFTGNPYVAKLLDTKAKLFGNERASAVIAISTDYTGDLADAEKALREFGLAIHGLNARLSEASRSADG